MSPLAPIDRFSVVLRTIELRDDVPRCRGASRRGDRHLQGIRPVIVLGLRKEAELFQQLRVATTKLQGPGSNQRLDASEDIEAAFEFFVLDISRPKIATRVVWRWIDSRNRHVAHGLLHRDSLLGTIGNNRDVWPRTSMATGLT